MEEQPLELSVPIISYNIIMSAFVIPLSTSINTRNFAFHDNGVSSRFVRVSPTISRRARIVCQEGKQFNYNIYQDFEDRSKRSLTNEDRAVAVQKPLGIVLEEGQDGMVFVAEVDPDGNAAETGEVQEGDILVAVSATFGDEVWSTRGVGLDRVLKSIRIRSGEYVTLVLESPDQTSARKSFSTQQAESRRSEARDKFGEREVVDPVSWRKEVAKQQEAIYEDSDPVPPFVDEELKEKLKKEIVAPYQQNWILWIGGGIFILVVLSVIFGIN